MPAKTLRPSAPVSLSCAKALLRACLSGNIVKAEGLLKAGANYQVANNHGVTPLMYAVSQTV